ncbi:MAG: FtsH protease activity modulator HflK [Thermodesulfobacteriota bacterium]
MSNGNGNGPWGHGTGGGEKGPGGRRPGNRPPDLDAVLKKSGDFFKDFKQRVPALGIVIVAIGIIFIAINSFYTVGPEEVGVIRRFGKVVKTTAPGPHFMIPLVDNVLKPQVTKVHRIEVGFKTIDPGPPARYTTIDQEALMLTGDENIVAVEFIIQFKIKDAVGFLFNVRNQRKTIRDAAEAAMREVVGKTRIDDILTQGRLEVQQEIRVLLQKILDSYNTGISIVAVQLQDVLPPREVIAAFKDVASAREDREKAVEQAEGYRNDIIPKAKGGAEKIINAAEAYKEANINKAKGDVSRFLQVLTEYRKARDITQKRIFIETMEEVLGDMDKYIVDEELQKNLLPYLPLGNKGNLSKGGKK